MSKIYSEITLLILQLLAILYGILVGIVVPALPFIAIVAFVFMFGGV